MSLPPQYSNFSEYFTEAVDILKEYSYIYCISNTRFIKDGVLDKIPSDWKEYFTTIDNNNLNNFPELLNQDTPPDTLKQFQSRLRNLKPHHKVPKFTDEKNHFKNMSPKKFHEISRLSQLITETCLDKTDVLIDFGSGLGYLSEILYLKHKFKILGIECDKERVITAQKKQQTSYADSKNDVFYRSGMITENSDQFLNSLISELYPMNNPRLAIIGLHACADLSIVSIKLFQEMNNVKKLIIMPCCYHKLEVDDGSPNRFKRFPISKILSNIVESIPDFTEFLNRPFLRLACQQTSARWKVMSEEMHFEHGINMYLRGLAECLIDKNEIVSKIKGPTIKNVISYENLLQQYEIKSTVDNTLIKWEEKHRIKFTEINSKYSEGNALSEGLTCLQTSLQDLCENVVLLDRVCFMHEYAEEHNTQFHIDVRKIVNDGLSPRCFAFIAEKLS